MRFFHISCKWLVNISLFHHRKTPHYYKWFRIATINVYTTCIKLHHYHIISLWKIIKVQNCTIQVHTFQPSKMRSSYLQRTAETYSFSCAISHMAYCFVLPRTFYGYIHCGFILSALWRFSNILSSSSRSKKLALNRINQLHLGVILDAFCLVRHA